MAKKLQLGYREIEERLKSIKDNHISAEEIGYHILYSFGKGERDIARYKEGKGILKTFDGLLIKGLFCYKTATTIQLSGELERLKHDEKVLKALPKIIAVSDGETLLAYDLREKDTYENKVERLYCDFAFFYPLMNVERAHYIEESPADVKAAEKLAKLHDELRAYNEFTCEADLHDLNIFITRLLFCFFAEDTGIFEEHLFSSSIRQFTKPDGSDLCEYLDSAFNIMDCEVRNPETLSIIKQFPYVNGGLFAKHIQIPKMGSKARKIILECGELDWKDINPDIFGSMIQAVVNPEVRANQGMHYTSVPNIMKVINPLFLDELRDEYKKLEEQQKQLQQQLDLGALNRKDYEKACVLIEKKCRQLLLRMSKMKFFDPACGSGNFLIITYKSLRLLEMDILKVIRLCNPGKYELNFIDNSCITLKQFYGIELLDFPHEVAMLSLWLAEHQMNRKFSDEFKVNTQALPLHNITQIVCGNACRLDWNVVCPHEPEEEVFVFGNPPYLGFRMQTEEQKEDMDSTFKNILPSYRKLDYISQWFYKGALYIRNKNSKCAFVSTNSVCQGEHIALLWRPIIQLKIDIAFAYTSFKWSNNAKNSANVICVIVGIENKSSRKKVIYTGNQKIEVDNISPLLNDKESIIIEKRNTSISGLKPIILGSLPADDNNLSLTNIEREELIRKYPEIKKYIKPFIGSQEYIKGIERYCLWVEDKDYEELMKIPEINKRFEAVRKMRLQSSKQTTVEKANRPWAFSEIRYNAAPSIIVPAVSSGRRKYIPTGFVKGNTVIYHSAFAIYNGDTYTLGIINSYIHVLWAKTVGGKLKNDYRYSAQLCYNTFPFPSISDEKKEQIGEAAENVLVTRAFYPERTLAELYDPDKMPEDLKEAHAVLDDIVESCYPGYPFANDEARLECLFKLYEKMTKNKTR